MPKCILSGQVKSTFTQEQADDRYIQMTNGATTTLASSLQVSGINNIEFTEEGEDPITASNVSYSNTTSGMTSGNVQNAIDELFQSVSEGKSLIAAAVTDKGVETAATDSFATMAGNIGQISSGGQIETVNFNFQNNAGSVIRVVFFNEELTSINTYNSGLFFCCKNSPICCYRYSYEQDVTWLPSGDYTLIYGSQDVSIYSPSGDFNLTVIMGGGSG